MGKYDNDFCSHPKKSVIKTFGDEVNLHKFYNCCVNLKYLIKEKGTIADVYYDLGCPSNKAKSNAAAELSMDLHNLSFAVKRKKEIVKLRIEQIDTIIKKLKSEREQIDTFISKLHCYIDTDIPHIMNKETGLKKIVLYYDRNIIELNRFKSYLEMYINDCTLLQGKSKYDPITLIRAKKFFSVDF